MQIIASSFAVAVLLTATAAEPPKARLPTFAADEPPGEWTMAAGDYASSRYSGLDAIDTRNVSRLEPVFEFDTGVDRGHEAAPIVVDGRMVVVTPFPNIVYAFDLSGSAPNLAWKHAPKPVAAAQGVACCDVVNRGAAYADGRIHFVTLDGRAIALDLDTGRELWNTKLADIHLGESMTAAPLVVKGKVLLGNSGGEFGVRGWLAALDAATGELAWKAYHTGPDREVLIGEGFRPYYASDRGRDLGVKTWPPEAWKIGGGTAWGWISFDPALDLIYYGTGNPGPWNHEQRPGDNKWTTGVFARDPDDGQARWFYQVTPHDHFDYDAINESILLDLPGGGDGGTRAVLVRAERNGFFYVLDRRTGEVFSADPFFRGNAVLGVDLESGRPKYASEKIPRPGKVVRNVCPNASGAKDWNPSAFSPRTGYVYIPHQNLCMDWLSTEVNYLAGTPYVGAEVRTTPGPGGHRGALTAWDPVARRAAFVIEENLPVWSGALATAGDLVFYGTMDGRFRAIDARTGKGLWEHRTASGIIGQPISYRGPDGRQFIAVLSGVGGWAGAIVAAQLDPRDSTSGLGMVNATRDLPSYLSERTGKLHVFALPD